MRNCVASKEGFCYMELFYLIIHCYSQKDDSLDVDFIWSEIVFTKFSTLNRTSGTFSINFDTAVSNGSVVHEEYLR